MEAFPVIQTNFWDAVIAVPIVVIITLIIKWLFHASNLFMPTIANILGLIISIFFAHKGNIGAGIFMGFFYGNAAVGVYYSIKVTLQSYIEKKKGDLPKK